VRDLACERAEIDRAAARVGVDRQAFIKMRLAETLAK
jgi:hypothetical protein